MRRLGAELQSELFAGEVHRTGSQDIGRLGGNQEGFGVKQPVGQREIGDQTVDLGLDRNAKGGEHGIAHLQPDKVDQQGTNGAAILEEQCGMAIAAAENLRHGVAGAGEIGRPADRAVSGKCMRRCHQPGQAAGAGIRYPPWCADRLLTGSSSKLLAMVPVPTAKFSGSMVIRPFWIHQMRDNIVEWHIAVDDALAAIAQIDIHGLDRRQVEFAVWQEVGAGVGFFHLGSGRGGLAWRGCFSRHAAEQTGEVGEIDAVRADIGRHSGPGPGQCLGDGALQIG